MSGSAEYCYSTVYQDCRMLQYCIPGLYSYKPGIAELAEARGDQLSFAPHYRATIISALIM